MQRQNYKTMVAALNGKVEEVFPWDLMDEIEAGTRPFLLDIRCPYEFDAAHIHGSVNVPRGILEMAADYGYEETVPMLVKARKQRLIVICRSGNRSILAGHTLRLMGFENVASLRTGLRGWNDYEQALVDADGNRLSLELADDYFLSRVSPEQLEPSGEKAA